MGNSADPDQLASVLDLHCLQKQDISGFSRLRVKTIRLYSHKRSLDKVPCSRTHYELLQDSYSVPSSQIRSTVLLMRVIHGARSGCKWR